MNAFLSNKLIHKFIDQYHNYNFTEQFMQAAKAMLYNNFESHDAIIAEEDPNELTRLGDKIEIHGSRPYTAAWEESNNEWAAMSKGMRLKFEKLKDAKAL
ncbi:hypothetical protein CC77DRAFT_1098943 [Alternaria alternata]|uniref:NADAR domain-containing protein n=1 Tax=Alternaria alternata TaxID=5599 RepID=A0A177D969_ALTAL|nr:hypothetical protein CC77DRAFT_1098943 [Alternaria alternata]OAG15801.1 hypothetical protein CC77DRAFT_1098943 [Alternaria alternata]RYO66262.1 hypothetical protein AA0116_g2351 [Alternaria tenuissima]